MEGRCGSWLVSLSSTHGKQRKPSGERRERTGSEESTNIPSARPYLLKVLEPPPDSATNQGPGTMGDISH